jgi:hypothetical protein
METMIIRRKNRIKVLIKLSLTNQITETEFKTEFQQLQNELYFFNSLN